MEIIEVASKRECDIPMGLHCVFLGIEFPCDLSDNELGVVEHLDVADTNVSGEAKTYDQCFIFNLIIACVEQETESTFEITTLRDDEDETSPTTFFAR